jgi:hypothetical protein
MATESKIDDQMDWEIIGQLEIQGKISISDSNYFYDQPVVVPLEAGRYSVSVFYGTQEGHRYIARARVAISEGPLKLGDEVGIVGVDFGQLGVCDRDSVETAFDILGDSRMPEYFDQLNTTDLIGTVKLPEEVKMLIFRPGFGDGSYPVYEILGSNGRRRGLEIDCLKDVE